MNLFELGILFDHRRRLRRRLRGLLRRRARPHRCRVTAPQSVPVGGRGCSRAHVNRFHRRQYALDIPPVHRPPPSPFALDPFHVTALLLAGILAGARARRGPPLRLDDGTDPSGRRHQDEPRAVRAAARRRLAARGRLRGGAVRAWPAPAGAATFGGSTGPGAVLAGVRCGPKCLQVVRFRDGAWQRLGEPLLASETATLHLAWDRGGAPWVVLHALDRRQRRRRRPIVSRAATG